MQKFQPGKEYPEPDEDKYISKIVSLFKKTLAGYYPTGLTKRIFHPKMHGLVQASLEVEKNLPLELQTTLFQPGFIYPAWIRLSNAKKTPAPDKKKDMRGMAIKLTGVPGEKLLDAEKDATTHDFVLVSTQTLQTRSVKDFWISLNALMGSKFRLALYAFTHPAVIWRSLKQISKCASLLETSYFSTTPYRYGKKNLAVKYAVIPEISSQTPFPKKPSDDFLKEKLIDDLSTKGATFSFMVQLQTDPDKMPVEDPTVRWNSPFIKIATIRIPKQCFSSKEQMEYGEGLSFTPWHCIEEHRPLGGVNRARRAVYQALSEFRHQRNSVTQEEPAFLKTFNTVEV